MEILFLRYCDNGYTKYAQKLVDESKVDKSKIIIHFSSCSLNFKKLLRVKNPLTFRLRDTKRMDL